MVKIYENFMVISHAVCSMFELLPQDIQLILICTDHMATHCHAAGRCFQRVFPQSSKSV